MVAAGDSSQGVVGNLVAGSGNDRVPAFAGGGACFHGIAPVDDERGWALEAGPSVREPPRQPTAAGGRALLGAPRATEPHAAGTGAPEPRRATKRRQGVWTYQGSTELRNTKFDGALHEQASEDAQLERDEYKKWRKKCLQDYRKETQQLIKQLDRLTGGNGPSTARRSTLDVLEDTKTYLRAAGPLGPPRQSAQRVAQTPSPPPPPASTDGELHRAALMQSTARLGL